MIILGNISIRSHPKVQNIFISGTPERPKLYTRNLVPGKSIYGEKLVEDKNIEYRSWDPFRSKLAAVLLNDPITDFLDHNYNCLYLGASSGTTVSHLSDILENGIIYSVEFAERSIRQLIQNTANRENVIPILGDARYPESYAKSIFSSIDLVYQDVAQPNQAEIAIANCNYYLKEHGYLILIIKSQSIDSVAKVEKVFNVEKNQLKKAGYNILESINIHEYSAEHMVLIVKKGD